MKDKQKIMMKRKNGRKRKTRRKIVMGQKKTMESINKKITN
jgi:hypothetical protein